jgi:hypothetical protein
MFLSNAEDNYRAAYAHYPEERPRQCVFFGTTNTPQCLTDITGGRRFLIVDIDQQLRTKDVFKDLDTERDQLWAEAVEGWKARMRQCREPGQSVNDVNLYLYLRDPKLEEEMETRRQAFKLPDLDRTDIIGYLETPRPDNWYDLPPHERRNFAKGDWIGDPSRCTLLINKVCIKELKYELFNDRDGKDLRIGDILDAAKGWKKGKPSRNKAYANWSMPMWVRIGSDADT